MKLTNLYRDNARRLERMIGRVLGSGADASDLTHDAFLRVFAAELGGRTELSTALLTITARRLALNELRNRTRRATDGVGDIESLSVLSDDDPVGQSEHTQLLAALENAMAAMPPQCRQVFRMRKVEGMSHADIATDLCISPKTVERHVTKAIKICREYLIARGHIAPGDSVDRTTSA